MVPLFNKVYLKSDLFFKPERERVFISTKYPPDVYDPGVRSSANQAAPIPTQLSATSYPELIETSFGGDESKFIQYLLNWPADRRLTIYTDLPTIVTIASKVWKTMLPSATEDDYRLLLNLMLSHFNMMYVWENREGLSPQMWSIIDNEFALVTADVEIFVDQWDTLKPATLNRTQRELLMKGAPIEFQIATVLTNPRWRYGIEAKKRVVTMSNKAALSDFVNEIKYLLLANLENIEGYDDRCTYDSTTTTLAEFVAANPQFNFLADPNVTPENLHHVMQNYDLDTFREWRGTVLGKSTFYVDQQLPLLKNNLTFEELIEYERSIAPMRILLNRGEYREKVNTRLLTHILAAYFAQDMGAIAPFCLR